MKKFITLLFILPLFLCCDKDDDNVSLPPATQTGEGTFGCTVNGKNFVHNDGEINCFYQYVDGGYYFSIQGIDKYFTKPASIRLETINKTISEEEVLPLREKVEGNASGGARFFVDIASSEIAFTNEEFTGELTIMKFDYSNRIVSGTFWFDLKNPYSGEKVEIRNGRFDSLF